MKINKKMVARSRLRYAQGSGIVGIVISISTLLILAKSFESFFQYLGIPVQIVYIVLPVGYLLFCWYVGMLYDTKGFWEEETSHANEFLNPEFSKMCEDMEKVKRTLEGMNENQRSNQGMEQRDTGSLPADVGRSDTTSLQPRV